MRVKVFVVDHRVRQGTHKAIGYIVRRKVEPHKWDHGKQYSE